MDNVISAELVKTESFLSFVYQSCENEYEHLADVGKQSQLMEKQMLKQNAINLHNDGLSVREIEQQIGIGKSTIQRWLKQSD